MVNPVLLQKLVYYLLQFVTFLGTAGWTFYWLTMRVPMADWRFLAVGLLLSAVLGWWPWISLAASVALSVSVGLFANDLDSEAKIQVIQEIAIFWALGLGWGVLARRWLAPPPKASSRHSTYLPPPPAQVSVRQAEAETFRSKKLMAGSFEETTREPNRGAPAPAVNSPAPKPEGGFFPVFKNEEAPQAPLVNNGSTPQAPPPLAAPGPLPRPVLPPPPAYMGDESVYLPSLPGLPGKESDHPSLDTAGPSPSDAPGLSRHLTEPLSQPGPIVSPVGAQTTELRLDQMPPRPPVLEDPSVMPAEEFPTLELPVNSLMRSPPKPSHNPNSSFHLPISSSGAPSTSGAEASESDGQTLRRSSSFMRPETYPGTPYEHLLEWYNQFSWSPWNPDELEKHYYRPGVHVRWESLAMADLAKAWRAWQAGPVPESVLPGQVTLGALEGFLRCEMLGVLRYQGFPDLHLLSTSTAGDIWVPVYQEVRGRQRGGDAIIHAVDKGEPGSDAKGLLSGRPDRLAEIRKESDVVSLVTPFSVGESLSWTGVYAVAQHRVAETMGWALSGVPVVVNLPLPIWDERKVCRVVVVDDVVTEQRRLDVALERFNRVLSGLVAPKPQTQSSVCSGCGWRHFCTSYAGARPRLDLSKPPQQLAAALR
jgi:hypothetical protein